MKNNKTQITNVATAEALNGNGHKTPSETKTAKTVEIEMTPDLAKNIEPESPSRYQNEIRFCDRYLKNAKILLDTVLTECEHSDSAVDALIMLCRTFEDILRKSHQVNGIQLAEDLKMFLFAETHQFLLSADAYVESIESGEKYPKTKVNYGVFKSPSFIEHDSEKSSYKFVEIVEPISSYFATEEKTPAEPVSAKEAEPSLFEIVRNANEKELGIILSALLDNETLPFQMHNEIFEGIGICMPPDHEDSNFEPEFVEKCIRFTNENSKTKKLASLAERLSALIEDPNLPEPLHDGILDLLTEMFNSHVDQSEFLKYEKSPEYISKLLCGYFSKCGNKAA